MSSKEKIVFYTQGLYPCNTGGMEIYNHYLISNISQMYPGPEWFVLTSCSKFDSDNVQVLPLKNKFFLVRRYGLGALSTVFSYLFSRKLKIVSAKRIIISYTDNFTHSALAFLLLKLLFRVPYVIHIHSGGLKPWKNKWLQQKFFKNADKIAGVSRAIVEEYSRRSQRPVKYLPPILPFKKSSKRQSVTKFENGLTDYDRIILFVGSLKPLKAPRTLLKAFTELGETFVKEYRIGLVFVGDGPLKGELQQFAASSRVKEHIHFVGKIQNEKVADFYAIADIFVIPSWFEGTPIALLEAMFNRLLCIGSNVKGINGIITHKKNGLLFKKDNYLQLRQLLAESIQKDINIESIRKSAEKFYHDNYNYSEHLKDFYSSFLF